MSRFSLPCQLNIRLSLSLGLHSVLFQFVQNHYRDLLEKLLHIMVWQSTGFYVFHPELLRHQLSLFCRYFLFQIALAGYQNLLYIFISVVLQVGNPVSHWFKGLSVIHIICYQNSSCSLIIIRCEVLESLLTCCVIHLNLNLMSVDWHYLELLWYPNR